MSRAPMSAKRLAEHVLTLGPAFSCVRNLERGRHSAVELIDVRIQSGGLQRPRHAGLDPFSNDLFVPGCTRRSRVWVGRRRRAMAGFFCDGGRMQRAAAQRRSRVFQAFQIDFCWQGGRTLREACERKGFAAARTGRLHFPDPSPVPLVRDAAAARHGRAGERMFFMVRRNCCLDSPLILVVD